MENAPRNIPRILWEQFSSGDVSAPPRYIRRSGARLHIQSAAPSHAQKHNANATRP